MMISLHFLLDDETLRAGLAAVAGQAGLSLCADGLPVFCARGEALRVTRAAAEARITYPSRAAFFRGVGLLARCLAGDGGTEICETPRFERCGVMLDCSRGAVLRVDAVKRILRAMALMGLDLAMMYTEDTYAVPEQPYWGHLRGRYTAGELRELDAYAGMLGIEMIPCIQTLAHLERVLAWPQMQKYRDAQDVLLTGEHEPATYELLRQCIRAAAAPFSSRRIHIGMDEAYWMGRGLYWNKYGAVSRTEMMRTHLRLVKRILDEEGLEAMMWSDMHFSAARDEGVYHPESELTPEILSAAPPDIGLVYWDYYHEDNAAYANMLEKHAQFEAPTIFAGGIWTWLGPAADYRKTFAATLPALEECVRHHVREVFATAWMDDGAECNHLCLLYGLSLFAEYNYTGAWDEAEAAARFFAATGLGAEAFLAMSRFNEAPGLRLQKASTANPCRVLLYEDPLIPMFEKDLPHNAEYAAHYAALAGQFDGWAAEFPSMAPQYGAYAALGRALSAKCRWRGAAADAVRGRDRAAAAALLPLADENIAALTALRDAWYAQWMDTNKPFGFEVLDIRLGGVRARFETAKKRMAAFADGTLADIPELSCEQLPVLTDEDGAFRCRNLWANMATASCMGKSFG